ncbi:MAG: pyridoxal phosphate-dependent aminotransferase [Bacteroidales bacterium]|nr:pyridoxal phosphate-dependent aminotransferase [Candidatus Colimorpha merdihippi]
MYNFDEILVRKGTNCVKHDALMENFGRDDLLPMWVADMDFRSPDFVMDALRQRCQHEVLGYATAPNSYWETLQQWLQKHYQIESTREELHFIPGIVAGIAFVLQAMTEPGDGILVTTPVYPPFLNLPQNKHLQLVCSPLHVEDGHWKIDFDDLEWRARQCRWMILSNPHNPGGTVWGKETLEKIAEICYRNNVSVIADEIHADMTLPPLQHVSFSTVSQQAKEISITFFAPSKTFNIAGLSSSACYCANESMRQRFYGYLDGYEIANGNIFAFVGAEAAFRHGEQWLTEMLQYIQGNIDLLKNFLSAHLPKAKVILPQASYLAWMDLSAMGMSHEELKERIYNQARIALNDGTTFGGKDYNCCFRINLGCPRATLQEALDRLVSALS